MSLSEKLLDYAKQLQLPEKDYDDFLKLTNALLRTTEELEDKTKQLETKLESGVTVSTALRSQIGQLKRTQGLLRDALRALESQANSPQAQRAKAAFAFFLPEESKDTSIARGLWVKALESNLSDTTLETARNTLRTSFKEIWDLLTEFVTLTEKHETVLQNSTWQHKNETGNVLELITSKEKGLQSLLNAFIVQFLATGIPLAAVILTQSLDGNDQIILDEFVPRLEEDIKTLKNQVTQIGKVTPENVETIEAQYQTLLESFLQKYATSVTLQPSTVVAQTEPSVVGYQRDAKSQLKQLIATVIPATDLQTIEAQLLEAAIPTSEEIIAASEKMLKESEQIPLVKSKEPQSLKETETKEGLTDAQKLERARKRKLAEGKISAYVRIRPPSETTLRNAGILPEKLTPPYVYTEYPNPLINYKVDSKQTAGENFETVTVVDPEKNITPEMRQNALKEAQVEAKKRSEVKKQRALKKRPTQRPTGKQPAKRPSSRRPAYVGSFRDYEYVYAPRTSGTNVTYETDPYFLSTNPKIRYPSSILQQMGTPYAADGVLDDLQSDLSFKAKTDKFYENYSDDVKNFVNGQDVLIVAYGPSGSGKSANTKVIAENAIQEMTRSPDFEGLWVAFVDLYSNSAYDVGKAMREDPVEKGRSLEGEIDQQITKLEKNKINLRADSPLWKQVRWIPVTKMTSDGKPDLEATSKTYAGLANKVKNYRVISPTPFNIESSRSHLLTLMRMTKDDPNLFTIADLAGEEKFGKKIGEDTIQKILQSLESDWVTDPKTSRKYVDSVASSLGGAWEKGKWKEALNKRKQGTRVQVNTTPSTKGLTRLKKESEFINTSLKGLEAFVTRLGEKNIKTLKDATQLGLLPTVLFKLTNPNEAGKTATLVSFLIALNRNPAQLAQNFQALSYANLARNLTLKYEFKRFLYEMDPKLLDQYQTFEHIKQELGAERHLVAHLETAWLDSLQL